MASPSSTAKRLFTGADVATGAVFSAIGLLAFRPAIDPDVFWHLATGKWIWANQAIPKADPFSWTTPGRAWIAHEWLIEAIWRVVYRSGGWGAMVALNGLILMATFVLVRATARHLGAGPMSASVFTGLSALAGLHTWNVRPQMISLAFSALFGYWFALGVVEPSHPSSGEENSKKAILANPLVWVPLVMLAWVNLHGGWVFGMAMLSAFAFASLAEVFLAKMTSSSTNHSADGALVKLFGIRIPQPKPLAKIAAGVFLCSVLVGFINPNGLKGVVYPFSYLGDNASTRYVNEWFAPSIAKVQYWPFFALLVLFVLALATGLRKLPLYVYAIGLPFSFLAVQSARNVSQFAVFTAPFLAQATTKRWATSQTKTASAFQQSDLESTDLTTPNRIAENGVNPEASRPTEPPVPTVPTAASATWAPAGDGTVLRSKKATNQTANPKAISTINLVVLVALVVSSAVLGFRGFTKKANLDAQARIYPVVAVQKLLANPGTKLLNDYDWGGYLTHVAPTIAVAIDGRPDMYGDAYTDNYVSMWRTNPGWQARLAKFDADRILAKPESPLAAKLRKLPEWQVSFEDNIAVLFSRR